MPGIGVESDHIAVFMKIRTGRMMRKQQPRNTRSRTANIAALQDPDKAKAYSEKVGSNMVEWKRAHPLPELEKHASYMRTMMGEVAFEVCGKQGRTVEGWFAARAEQIVEAQAARNESVAASMAAPQNEALRRVMQNDRKIVRQVVAKAKLAYIEELVQKLGAGQQAYWQAVKALTGTTSRAKKVENIMFKNAEGILMTDKGGSAAAAAAHFTKVYNIDRDRPAGSDETIERVRQRPVYIDLDEPITENELRTALKKAKSNKSTSNMVPIELYKACAEDPDAMRGLLLLGEPLQRKYLHCTFLHHSNYQGRNCWLEHANTTGLWHGRKRTRRPELRKGATIYTKMQRHLLRLKLLERE
jgi:hypothetical protein